MPLVNPPARGVRRPDSLAKLRTDVWTLLFHFYDAGRPVIGLRVQEMGLTLQQGYLLRILRPGEPLAMSAAAEVFSCDASNMTGIVKRLEARGLIRREAPPGDKRVKMILLTRAGEAFQAKLFKRMYEPAALLDGLTAAQLRQLRTLLAPVIARLPFPVNR